MKKIVSLIFVASLYIGVSPTYVFAQNIFTKPACGTEVNCWKEALDYSLSADEARARWDTASADYYAKQSELYQKEHDNYINSKETTPPSSAEKSATDTTSEVTSQPQPAPVVVWDPSSPDFIWPPAPAVDTTVSSNWTTSVVWDPSSPDFIWPPAPAADTASSNWTTVTVTEDIPGLWCTPAGGTTVETRKFKCTIPGGFMGVMFILRGMIKYLTFIVALVGVLMLVVSGIQYSLAGAQDGAVKEAKGRVTKVISGLTLLFMIGLILNSVAPWVYK